MSLKLAIMVSGKGSNMSSILQAVKEDRLQASVSLVFSNNPQALALPVAANLGVPTASIGSSGMSRQEHEQSVLKLLAQYEFDYLVLAGYMRILSENFLRPFYDERGFFRIINIHPSLLPAFPGANAYEDAFNYGVRKSGITVHLVDEKVDHGPILAQECFPRVADDTLETFKARGLEVEHRLYPEVLQSIAREGINLLPRQMVKTDSDQRRARVQ